MSYEKISTSPTEYVVLDIETNGLKSYADDLLSISIYKPDNENIYNRFLPLELNDQIPKYITEINGIHKKDVRDKKPLSQDEVDQFFSDFELDRRTILTYGEMDKRFIRDYFRRHNLIGYDDMNFYNFKEMICTSPFSNGAVSKDSLCKMFGIDGVSEVHSSINDCHLEWELFKNIDGRQLIVTEGTECLNVFELTDEYIIPVSYLKYTHMSKYFEHPKISCQAEEIQRFEIYNEGIRRFPNNISGIAIEHLLNTMLHVVPIDSRKFLISNKSSLKYIGKIPSAYHEIPVVLLDDGTISAIRPEDRAFAKTVSKVNVELKSLLQPVVDFITHEIFNDPDQIFSQELSIDERGILALCDLSTKDTVLEIKTSNEQDLNKYAEQLFYEAQGRPSYLLTMDWSQLHKVILIFTKVDPYIKTKNKIDKQTNGEVRDQKTKRESKRALNKTNNHSMRKPENINPITEHKKERRGKGETMPRKPVVSRSFDISVYDVYCAELDPEGFKHIEVRINSRNFKPSGGAEQFKAYLPENCYPLSFEKVRDEVDVYEMPEEQFLKVATIKSSYIV